MDREGEGETGVCGDNLASRGEVECEEEGEGERDEARSVQNKQRSS